MANSGFQSGQGSLWVQSAPGEDVEYLGCHSVGDIAQPFGDITYFYCPDPARNGEFQVIGQAQGQPGAVTTSIETVLGPVQDALMALNCPVNIFVNKFRSTGRRDLFGNRDMSIVIVGARRTNRGWTNVLSRDPEDNALSLQTADFSAETVVEFYSLAITRLTTTEAGDLVSIAFCSQEQCEDEQNIPIELCEQGFAAAQVSGAGDTAGVIFTENAGGSWAVAAALPFAIDLDISRAICVDYGGGTRHIVARGETVAATPAAIAYSDDGGATWTTVTVGSVNTQFITALWAVDAYAIWAGANDGYLYRSDDAGVTWTVINAGTLTVNPINAIHAYDRDNVWAVSNTGVVLRTTNGDSVGPIFAATTVPVASNLNTVDVHSANRAWVGAANGSAYLTKNGGDTWTAKFSRSGAATTAIRFSSEGIGGFLLSNVGGVGTVYQSINGGATWEAITTPTNTGLNDVWVCDPVTAYVVGNAQGGTGFLARVAPAA